MKVYLLPPSIVHLQSFLYVGNFREFLASHGLGEYIDHLAENGITTVTQFQASQINQMINLLNKHKVPSFGMKLLVSLAIPARSEYTILCKVSDHCEGSLTVIPA